MLDDILIVFTALAVLTPREFENWATGGSSVSFASSNGRPIKGFSVIEHVFNSTCIDREIVAASIPSSTTTSIVQYVVHVASRGHGGGRWRSRVSLALLPVGVALASCPYASLNAFFVHRHCRKVVVCAACRTRAESSASTTSLNIALLGIKVFEVIHVMHDAVVVGDGVAVAPAVAAVVVVHV